MYQFTTTTIINSSLDSNGTTAKYSGTATAFNVTRVNKFLKANVLSIYKRPYTAGVKEIAKITVTNPTSGLVHRLTIDIRLSQSTYSEYANTYLYFKKPVVVEVIASGTAATDAIAFAAQINSLKGRFGSNYVVATLTNSGVSAEIVLTATDFNQRFFSVVSSVETANTNSLTQVDFVTAATGAVTTAGALGFGDDEWMVKSIMVPTLENTRYFGINKDGRPVLGGNYTEYTLRYSVAKDGDFDGIVSGTNSVTTHVFYVKSDLVSGFEAAIAAVSLNIDTIGITVTDIAITNALDLSDYASLGYTIAYTTTPAGATGAYWVRDTTTDVDASGSGADFTKVTISPLGVVTLATGHGLANTDSIGVKATIDGVTIAKVITVQS